jgi:hypothetical protein
VSCNQKLTIDFIREFADRVDWRGVSCYQALSDADIREFADKVDWYWICNYQTLSESLIREFVDRVDWSSISNCQTLSKGFIREYRSDLVMCQNLKWCIQRAHISAILRPTSPPEIRSTIIEFL